MKEEDEKMRRCLEDVKMRRRFTDPHYWKNPALRRSREKRRCGVCNNLTNKHGDWISDIFIIMYIYIGTCLRIDIIYRIASQNKYGKITGDDPKNSFGLQVASLTRMSDQNFHQHPNSSVAVPITGYFHMGLSETRVHINPLFILSQIKLP